MWSVMAWKKIDGGMFTSQCDFAAECTTCRRYIEELVFAEFFLSMNCGPWPTAATWGLN